MATEKTGGPPSVHRDAETGADRRIADGQDVAIAMVGESPHAIDPAVTARAVRKIDWFLIPAMIFGCTCPSSGEKEECE